LGGDGRCDGSGIDVRVAALLVTVPAVLLTTTSKVDPLSEVVVAGVVSLAEVAPAMFTLFFSTVTQGRCTPPLP